MSKKTAKTLPARQNLGCASVKLEWQTTGGVERSAYADIPPYEEGERDTYTPLVFCNVEAGQCGTKAWVRPSSLKLLQVCPMCNHVVELRILDGRLASTTGCGCNDNPRKRA